MVVLCEYVCEFLVSCEGSEGLLGSAPGRVGLLEEARGFRSHGLLGLMSRLQRTAPWPGRSPVAHLLSQTYPQIGSCSQKSTIYQNDLNHLFTDVPLGALLLVLVSVNPEERCAIR